jgi:type III pantothenate kinase
MRVALVSEHASPIAALGGEDAGGQNVHVEALATNLARLGAEVVVHTRRDDPDLPERVLLDSGVVVHHVDAGPAKRLPKDHLLEHMGAFGAQLDRAWSARLPDVVHTHFWMSGLAALEPTARLGIPLVHTFHALGVVKRRYQGAQDTSPPERLESERELLRRVDRVVATCTDEVFELIRQGAEHDQLTVIPCGVDLARFTPEGPREVPTCGQRIVCVARLVERKGVGNVISALAQLDGVQLVIAGGSDSGQLENDPGIQRLRRLAEEAGVVDHVELRGRVERDDLPALLRSAACVVCVPWYEPFGIVALEAMACGVPVVASAVGGMIDTVVDGVTGVHVPPRDPDRLADALAGLLADSGRRRELGLQAVERARRRYDWARVAQATRDVYDDVIAKRSRATSALPTTATRHIALLREGLARVLSQGGRLLAVGNGGSAAEAQHLTAEFVGRFEDERPPLSALCLHGDTSSLTAIVNDYGAEAGFARQVRAHGRPGDVLLALSTSGRSTNVIAAVEAARECGMTTWAFTGPAPNPLADACDDAACLSAADTSTLQELHLVTLHLICKAVDRALREIDGEHAGGRQARPGAMA